MKRRKQKPQLATVVLVFDHKPYLVKVPQMIADNLTEYCRMCEKWYNDTYHPEELSRQGLHAPVLLGVQTVVNYFNNIVLKDEVGKARVMQIIDYELVRRRVSPYDDYPDGWF